MFLNHFRVPWRRWVVSILWKALIFLQDYWKSKTLLRDFNFIFNSFELQKNPHSKQLSAYPIIAFNDNNMQSSVHRWLYIYIYIYISVCACVCVCVRYIICIYRCYRYIYISQRSHYVLSPVLGILYLSVFTWNESLRFLTVPVLKKLCHMSEQRSLIGA